MTYRGVSAAGTLVLIVSVALLASLATAGAVRAVTLTDEAGRQVRVPDRSERIVSLAPSITEILFAIGAGARVVGVTQYSNYPLEAARLPKVGSYVNLSLEKILALRPDLVIGIRDGNPKAVIDRLAELGVPCYIVDPTSLDGVVTTVRNIGRAVGREQAAYQIAGQMASRIRDVERRVAGLARPRVFYQIGVEPIVSAGQGTFPNILIDTAGGKNVAADMAAYPQLNVEQVLVARPEIIIVTSMTREYDFERVRGFWGRWPGLPAVAAARIYVVDSDLMDRPSPRIVEGLETLARLIHPQKFK
jgi:iron complex transport system substrate-binding protein